MKRPLLFAVLTVVLTLACWLGQNRTAHADGTCESMQGKPCPFRGLESPCVYADGISVGLCTCYNRWDCLI